MNQEIPTIEENDSQKNPLRYSLENPNLENSEKIIETSSELAKKDPAYNKVFEAECLIFLITADKEYFEKNYNGYTDEQGYLLDKNGEPSNTLPSQNINRGIDHVSKIALERYGIDAENI